MQQSVADGSARSAFRIGVATPGIALVVFVALTAWYGHTHSHLGMPWAPFYVFPRTQITWWLVPCGAIVVGCVLAAGRLMSARSDRWFVAGVFGLTLVDRLAVNALRHGPVAWARPFHGFEGGQEYVTTVRRVTHNPIQFLEHFARLVPTLPTHSAGHPPGPSLIAIVLNDIGFGGAWWLAIFVIIVGTCAAPLTFVLARSLGHDRPTARLAAVLAAFAPAAVLESVTSMDAVFATLAVGTLIVIARRRYWIGGALVWLCSFMSYALVAVPVWGAVVMWRRYSAAVAIRVLVSAAVVTVGAYLFLRLAIGYDLIGAFRGTNHRYLYGPGSDAMHRPLRFWLFGDAAAFLFGLGLPVIFGLGVALRQRSSEAWALALVIAMAAIGGYTKGEVERIWLFMIPLAALAAAVYLPSRARAVTAMVGLLAVQAVIVEVLVSTNW